MNAYRAGLVWTLRLLAVASIAVSIPVLIDMTSWSAPEPAVWSGLVFNVAWAATLLATAEILHLLRSTK